MAASVSKTVYSIRSSVMGNQVLTEVSATGAKVKTYVRGAGNTIAVQVAATSVMQTNIGYVYIPAMPEKVMFSHVDPAAQDEIFTKADGALFTALPLVNGDRIIGETTPNEFTPAKLDVAGASLGFETPYSYTPPQSPQFMTASQQYGFDGAHNWDPGRIVQGQGNAPLVILDGAPTEYADFLDRTRNRQFDLLAYSAQQSRQITGYQLRGIGFGGQGTAELPANLNTLSPADRQALASELEEGATLQPLYNSSWSFASTLIPPAAPDPPQTPVKEDNPATITQNGKNCNISVSFTKGLWQIRDEWPNGVGEIKVDGEKQTGLGFTVSGSVKGGIGYIGNTSTPNPENPKGKWTIQQFVANHVYDNGIVVDEAARQELVPDASLQISGDKFAWWDHPGRFSAGVSSHYRKTNFVVKVIDGKEQCELKFHVLFVFDGKKWDISWGSGNF